MTNNEFRFDAKRVFLTYPQCGNHVGIDNTSSHLKSLGATGTVVGRETHRDGGLHIHAYAEWTDRFRSRNPRIFDINGRHPNIQAVRNKSHVIQYIKKGGDYLSDVEDASGIGRYADLCEADSREEFWNTVRQKYHRDYVLNLDRLTAFCEHRFGTVHEPYETRLGGWKLPAGVKKWVDEELNKNDRPKSLWLVGPSRTGKTEWARSLGEKHLYWNGSIDLGTFDPQAQYSIFDDFDWKYLPYKKQFGGGQKQFVVTDKYRKKKTITWGKPSIFIWNPDNNPWNDFTAKEIDWWMVNCIRVVITEPLFSIENVWVEV